MAQKCQISGQRGLFGHRVSHANNKTKHVFLPNLQVKRIYVPEEKRWVRVRVSTRIIRTIDKIGFVNTLRKYKLTMADVAA